MVNRLENKLRGCCFGNPDFDRDFSYEPYEISMGLGFRIVELW